MGFGDFFFSLVFFWGFCNSYLLCGVITTVSQGHKLLMLSERNMQELTCSQLIKISPFPVCRLEEGELEITTLPLISIDGTLVENSR